MYFSQAVCTAQERGRFAFGFDFGALDRKGRGGEGPASGSRGSVSGPFDRGIPSPPAHPRSPRDRDQMASTGGVPPRHLGLRGSGIAGTGAGPPSIGGRVNVRLSPGPAAPPRHRK